MWGRWLNRHRSATNCFNTNSKAEAQTQQAAQFASGEVAESLRWRIPALDQQRQSTEHAAPHTPLLCSSLWSTYISQFIILKRGGGKKKKWRLEMSAVRARSQSAKQSGSTRASFKVSSGERVIDQISSSEETRQSILENKTWRYPDLRGKHPSQGWETKPCTAAWIHSFQREARIQLVQF